VCARLPAAERGNSQNLPAARSCDAGGTTLADLVGHRDVHFAQCACQEAVVITQRSRHIQILTLGFFVTAAVGCAANLPETRSGRAAGEWQFQLPATRSSIGGLAFGRGGSSAPAERTATPEQPTQLLAAAAVPAKSTPRVQRVRHVPAPPVLPEAAPVDTHDSQEPPAAAPTVAPAPVQLAQAEASPVQRYREREASTPKLEQFRGGDAIVISVSALLIVLLIVILILLLR
jgi:hypothetical protein